MNFNDVLTTLNDKLKSPIGSVIRDSSVALASIDPASSVVAATLNSFYQNYNYFKITRLLKGLSKGINEEKCLYELNEYINSSEERAYLVGNIFKETLAAESPRVAELYGIILSKHIGSYKSNFTHDELIICKAIENANDYDLDIFKDIMSNSVLDNKGGKPIWLPKDKQIEYDLTCQWCVYNRLFWLAESGIIIAGTPMPINTVETNYHTLPPAFKLMKYIDELGTTWDMNGNKNSSE